MTPDERAFWARTGEIVFRPQNEPWIVISSWTGALPASDSAEYAAVLDAMRRNVGLYLDETGSEATARGFTACAVLRPYVRSPENYRLPRPWETMPAEPSSAWYADQRYRGYPTFALYGGGVLRWDFTVQGPIAEATTFANTIREAAINPHLRHFAANYLALTDPVADGDGWTRVLLAARPPFAGQA